VSLGCLVDKALAILKRDLISALRYRNGFLLTGFATAAELAAFYFLARAIGPGFRPEGVEYFPFVLVGTGFYTFLVMGIHSFLQVIQEAQQTGTLEVLMTTSTPAPMLLFLSAMSAFAGHMVQLVIYIGGGLLLFRMPLANPNLPGCALVVLLSLVIAVALGIFAAALQLAIQKGSALLWLFGSGTWFLTGTLFPIETLPKPLHALAEIIPVTHSLNGMRLALLQGANFAALRSEVLYLAIFALLLLPMSLMVFSHTLRQARLNGSLSFY
jgi:ABC-2 type transport system permease protein